MGLSILAGLGLVLMIIPILNLLLPNFKVQQQIVQAASMLKLSSVEMERLHQNRLILSLSDQLEKKKLLDRLLGERFRKMYNGLNKKDSFPIFISKNILMVLLMSMAPLLINTMLPNIAFVFAAPAILVLLFFGVLYKIKEDYQVRQNIILRDLPDLIAKMKSSLSVGRPLDRTLEEFGKTCSPELNKMLMTLVANMNIMPMRNALQIFATDVDFPEMHDFISVVNVIVEKGYEQGESQLRSISKDLKYLRKRALQERTKSNPNKFNLLYALIVLSAVMFPFLMVFKLFSSFSTL